MRVRILSVTDHCGHEIVEFAYGSGRGLARWKSKSSEIPVGKDVDVEMDIDTVMCIGKNAALVSGKELGISFDEKCHVAVIMVIEGQDEDGMAYGRLGRDCLVMIEVENDNQLVAGTCVSIQLQPLDLCLTAI